jgi:hypothetical protein
MRYYYRSWSQISHRLQKLPSGILFLILHIFPDSFFADVLRKILHQTFQGLNPAKNIFSHFAAELPV